MVYDRVVLGLTTIPARVKDIGVVFKGVAYQTRKPDAFYVSVPAYSAREKKPYPLEELKQMLQDIVGDDIGVLNVIDNDYGPLTKLVGMLLAENKRVLNPKDQGQKTDCNTLVVTVDDDHLLNPAFLEVIVAKAEKYYGEVVAFAGQNIGFAGPLPVWSTKHMFNSFPARTVNMKEGEEVNVVMGVGGVGYPLFRLLPNGPVSPDTELLDKELESYRIVGTPTTIENFTRHDDMYISCWMNRLSVKKRVIEFLNGEEHLVQLPQSQENALCAFDSKRTLGRSAGHLVQWLNLSRKLIRKGLLEPAHKVPFTENITYLSITTLAVLGAVTIAGVVYFKSKKK